LKFNIEILKKDRLLKIAPRFNVTSSVGNTHRINQKLTNIGENTAKKTSVGWDKKSTFEFTSIKISNELMVGREIRLEVKPTQGAPRITDWSYTLTFFDIDGNKYIQQFEGNGVHGKLSEPKLVKEI